MRVSIKELARDDCRRKLSRHCSGETLSDIDLFFSLLRELHEAGRDRAELIRLREDLTDATTNLRESHEVNARQIERLGKMNADRNSDRLRSEDELRRLCDLCHESCEHYSVAMQFGRELADAHAALSLLWTRVEVDQSRPVSQDGFE